MIDLGLKYLYGACYHFAWLQVPGLADGARFALRKGKCHGLPVPLHSLHLRVPVKAMLGTRYCFHGRAVGPQSWLA